MAKLKRLYGRKGYLKEVRNTAGKKAPVYIYQGRKPGFSVAYSKSHRTIKKTGRNAEKFATRLAKSGHKKVTFRD